MRGVIRVAISGVTVFAATLTAALAVATPAEAATPRIEITKVYYDSPGTDRGSNASLNDEWVRLTNRVNYAVNLKGWTLRDKANHIYTFRSDFRLQPGRHVHIHTGSSTNNSSHRFWNKSWYVWNNTGDKAYLCTPSGTLIDSCSWGDGVGYTNCG